MLVNIIAATIAQAQVGPIPANLEWSKVVNNLDNIPGTEKKFNSYNQPSLNAKGFVVFRARSKGPNQPVSGIFARNMASQGAPIEKIMDRETIVPAPNNTTYPPDNLLGTFIEFPSIPRIGTWSRTIATRGNSQPVWTYLVDALESRVGTTGIFVNPGGQLLTGASLLGAVPAPTDPVIGENYFPYFAVPGAPAGTRFDVFPGGPSITDHNVIAFKGNYTDVVGKTGVFYRDLIGAGGLAPVQLVANSNTLIPNLPEGVSGIPFGSTAPPSAAGCEMVFAGYDNESAPTYGGIYRAPLIPNPPLTMLIGIGSVVPGVDGQTFTQFGEALAFDGRYMAFWGAWGAEKKTLWLDCPTDGNADLLAYCRDFVGDNFPVQVPVNQGVFVHDTSTGVTKMIARTGAGLDDFLYWVFSGRPPGVGESDETDGEPPRWRSSAFVALSGGPGNTVTVAFKGRTGMLDPVEHNYVNPVDGIYMGNGTELVTVLDTTMGGQGLDPAAPVGSKITALAIEREGFRGRWLGVAATMATADGEESLAGVYATKVSTNVSLPQAGYYSGLLRLTDVAGKATLRVGKKGAFTGTVQVGDLQYRAKGVFDGNGKAVATMKLDKQVTRTIELAAITVGDVRALEMNLPTAQVAATALNSSEPITGTAILSTYPNTRADAAPTGRYTMIIPMNPAFAGNSAFPHGTGFMTIRTTNSGNALYAGKFGDSQSFTGSALVTEDGAFPLYIRSYVKPHGQLAGMVSFVNVPEISDLEARLDWSRPAQARATKLYPAGFEMPCIKAIGSRYVASNSPISMLQLGFSRSVSLSFTGEGLAVPSFSATAWINRTPLASVLAPMRRFALSPVNGRFNGRVLDGSKVYPFAGVILQKQNRGAGILRGDTQTSDVQLLVLP